jgi:hypothetical protein
VKYTIERVSKEEGTRRIGKALFVLGNLLFAVSWVDLLVRAVRHWHVMSTTVQRDASYLLAMSLLLWLNLLRERSSGLCLSIAAFAFLGAVNFAVHFF